MDPILAKLMEGKTDLLRPSVPEEQWLAIHPELVFFNCISGFLDIVIDPDPQYVNNLGNLKAPDQSVIKSISLKNSIYEDADNDHRELTESELSQPAFNSPSISMFGAAREVVEHTAPNGQYFTVSELLQAVEDTEKSTRANSEWLGGINIHHIAFEGISLREDGTWMISWGS